MNITATDTDTLQHTHNALGCALFLIPHN